MRVSTAGPGRDSPAARAGRAPADARRSRRDRRYAGALAAPVAAVAQAAAKKKVDDLEKSIRCARIEFLAKNFNINFSPEFHF